MLTDEAASSGGSTEESAALSMDGDRSPDHLPDCIDSISQRVDDRSLTAVVLIDASHLETWEFEHGAQAFNDVMLALWQAGQSITGSVIRQEDEVCIDAPGGDSLLVFVAESRSLDGTVGGQPPAPSALGRLAERTRSAIVRACQRSFDNWIGDAVDRTRAGAAPLNQTSTADPRREIYRAIRRARASIRGRATDAQRRRHEAIGSIIADEQIRTLYQPIVDLEASDITAFEALSRPENSAIDHLDDDTLFEAAQKAELDDELDRLCRRLAIDRHPDLDPDDRLFVNCLPTTFCSPLDDLRAVLDRWENAGLDPGQLVFEINENVSQQQADRIFPTIRRLRERGFHFALDDMGTGTTNLRVLAELEPAFIKMDISLTAGIDDNTQKKALASYLLDLADASGATLVAEGIESQAELDTVRQLGIRLGQGFFLGRPRRQDN